MNKIWLTLLALGALCGCLTEKRQLLCTSDDQCADNERCERVSGLCVPSAGRPVFEMGGAAGAFDCALPATLDSGVNQNLNLTSPGLATVNIISPGFDAQCDELGGGAMQGPFRIEGLKTGCTVRRLTRMVQGGEVDFYELEFVQTDTTPNDPKVRLQFYFRTEDLVVGTYMPDSNLSVLYSERCRDSLMEESELRLRFVSTRGEFEVTSTSDGRFVGRFDVDLVDLARDDAKTFGRACTPPRGCGSRPCADVELTTAECASGICQLDRMDPTAGFCSGLCDDSLDCGFQPGSNTQPYCLKTPNQREGRCIMLCNPDDDRASCPTGSSCRSGDDFLEFFNTPGPARCLDNCIATPSRPMDAICEGGGPTPDAGARPDARPPPDSGRPPMDAGVVRDSGPADAGAPTGTPLGTACTANSCPNGWDCVTIRSGSTSPNGYCSMSCTQGAACAQGYDGPGRAFCGARVRNVATGAMTPSRMCAVDCALMGAQTGCPGNMTCSDLVNNAMPMQAMPDGMNDLCAEP